MKTNRFGSAAVVGFIIASIVIALPAPSRGQPDATLPAGVKAVWDLSKAWREATPTRERLCVNGLWRWQPAPADAKTEDAAPPSGVWGYFKVPGCWPGITDYMQEDSQTVYPHLDWKGRKIGDVTAAWYQREIEVPADWAGRRIALSLDTLNSYAAVYVDGKKAGEARFPAGEVDLTAVCRPGQKHVLSLVVVAMPLKAVLLSYRDTNSATQVKGSVPRRGLCGDVYLVATPAGPRLGDVRVRTSVRRGEITIDAGLLDMAADGRYVLRAKVTEQGKEVAQFASDPFKGSDAAGEKFSLTAKWKPDRLWDLNTPGNLYDVEVSLAAAEGKMLDTAWPSRVGFRELWIDGRDFYLNGSRLFLSAVPLDNASIGASQANYAAARETLERLKSIGINYVYTHNYDCEPGSHLAFDEILRAADDVGVLVGLTQPHFSHYDWKAADADESNGYARHAAYYAAVAGNHPSVVFYPTSHNACGYEQDMDPDLLDGSHDPRDTWSSNNAKLALRAEAIIRKLDPTRIVYHHAGGNIGAMHTANFYPNFAPAQELSDWFAHWASAGVKPVFLCEYGAPFTWDWTMYRGWYKGQREWGSAAVPWEFCLAEWDAQFLGDRAYALGDREKANLRWEAKQFRAEKVWHRWDYPTEVGSARFEDRQTVLAGYVTDNWRAYRTWGVSGISPWEYEAYWLPRDGVDRGRKQFKVDWDRLQRPGFSPDYAADQVQRMDAAYDRADWLPTAAGKALLRNNQPVLAYIAGPPSAFTAKDHNFRPGDPVEKQLTVINNSRRPLKVDWDWSLQLPRPVAGHARVLLNTGQIAQVPLHLRLPADLPPGTYELQTTAHFGPGEEQADTFTLHVLRAPPKGDVRAKVALFDPKGETAAWLEKQGVGSQKIEAGADLSVYDLLIVGKLALTESDPAPDLSHVRDGLRVIVFEQSSQALERRLGFRTAEYGLRQLFPRVPGHPLLAGVPPDALRDWRGEATTVPPRGTYDVRPRYGPTVEWCGLRVPHLWRCGNRGGLASVLIEKPTRGDFLPIFDGGYDLQCSPLLEYREGKGMVLFCQLDVTGRTEADPAAEAIAANILHYAATWKPKPSRQPIYVGGRDAKKHLDRLGIDAAPYASGKLPPAAALLVGPGAAGVPHPPPTEVDALLKSGGRVIAIALDQPDADAVLPMRVTLAKKEHISAFFESPGVDSPLAGVGPADAHVRDPRELPLVTAGATALGDGVLAFAPPGAAEPGVLFCQLAPWTFEHGFDRPPAPGEYRQYSLKRSYRRSSFLLTRLLANQGVTGKTPFLERFADPLKAGTGEPERRWLTGLYLDVPEEWDDPYRFFRW